MESIYDGKEEEMNRVMNDAIREISDFSQKEKEKNGENPIEHLTSRIKSEDSMREKLRRRGLEETADNALNVLTDAIGIRVVCAFRNDVYLVRDWLRESDKFEVIQEKDYIKKVKENGYRSYHMITRFEGYFIEIQIRTISMDTWAALEHQIKYKKNVGGNIDLISAELKRCADDLASTDISMQTLRDMIRSMDDREA
jgi:ppGpp synthetase/RelA/SpoT-type nucleotidyltranferase